MLDRTQTIEKLKTGTQPVQSGWCENLFAGTAWMRCRCGTNARTYEPFV